MRTIVIAMLLGLGTGLVSPTGSLAAPLNAALIGEAAAEGSVLQNVQVCNHQGDWCRGTWRWRCNCHDPRYRGCGWVVVSYTSCKGKKQGWQ
jgi:hypothetical protein